MKIVRRLPPPIETLNPNTCAPWKIVRPGLSYRVRTQAVLHASWSTRTNTRSRRRVAAGASPHLGVTQIPRTGGCVFRLPSENLQLHNCCTKVCKIAPFAVDAGSRSRATCGRKTTTKTTQLAWTSALCTSKTCAFESIALCTKNPPMRSKTLAHPQVFLPGKVRRFK